MTSAFDDISPGDELWVINGHQTSAFEANVVEVGERTIVATVPEKHGDQKLFFSRNSGQAVVGGSFLARDDDWRVKVILDRKDHAQWHEKIIQLTAAYKKDPTAENGYALTDAVEDWRTFVTTEADPVALRVDSVDEYLAEKVVASV